MAFDSSGQLVIRSKHKEHWSWTRPRLGQGPTSLKARTPTFSECAVIYPLPLLRAIGSPGRPRIEQASASSSSDRSLSKKAPERFSAVVAAAPAASHHPPLPLSHQILPSLLSGPCSPELVLGSVASFAMVAFLTCKEHSIPHPINRSFA